MRLSEFAEIVSSNRKTFIVVSEYGFCDYAHTMALAESMAREAGETANIYEIIKANPVKRSPKKAKPQCAQCSGRSLQSKNLE